MVDPATIGLAIGGAVLLLFGAVLSIYGVALLGIIVGAGGGYLIAPTIGDAVGVSGVAAVGAGILIGALAGLVATYLLLSIAIAGLSFIVGSYFGMVVVAPALDKGIFLTVIIGIGVGIAAALLGMFMKRTSMILITSFLGAALASLTVTLSDLNTAANDVTLDPILFDPVNPVFGGLFVLGILSQFGLFQLGYVSKLVKKLPGAIPLTDSRESEA